MGAGGAHARTRGLAPLRMSSLASQLEWTLLSVIRLPEDRHKSTPNLAGADAVPQHEDLRAAEEAPAAAGCDQREQLSLLQPLCTCNLPSRQTGVTGTAPHDLLSSKQAVKYLHSRGAQYFPDKQNHLLNPHLTSVKK